ncbi:MAG: LD-carboxypeptidase [Prevotella sp.]|jgi:muramoyltetrapeptide carboxypeptidase|nr:LD-carboxypeptidase [Prevotella sp.]
MNRRNFLHTGIALSITSLIPTIMTAKNNTADEVNKRTTKAARLCPGDKIGMTAPAYLLSEDALQSSIENLQHLGFEPLYSDKILGKHGYFSGTDKERAEDFNNMIKNPEIKGIIFAAGGYGCTRILDMIDYKAIKKNPKVIMGFSDDTALINTIYRKTGLITFHGPVAKIFDSEYSRKQFMDVVMYPTDRYTIESSSDDLLKAFDEKIYERYTITPGKVRGELVGGNLTLFSAMMGTPYQINLKNKIVMIEDVGEEPYRIDRMLTQLIASGELAKARGIVFGVNNDCDISEKTNAPNSFTLREVIEDRIKPLNIPAVHGLSFGHISNNFTFPIGIEAELDTMSMTIKLMEKAVV